MYSRTVCKNTARQGVGSRVDLLLSELVSPEFANSGRLLGNSARPVNLASLGLYYMKLDHLKLDTLAFLGDPHCHVLACVRDLNTLT